MAGKLICENLRNLRIIKKHPPITQIKKMNNFCGVIILIFITPGAMYSISPISLI